MSHKYNVCYIAGCGRSGSTIFSILLGTHPDIFYAGELFAWPLFKGVPNNPSNESKRFWNEVLKDSSMKQSFENINFHKYLERWTSLLTPRVLKPKGIVKQHISLNHALIESIRQKTKAKSIIDSSHFPLRLKQLLKTKLEIKTIHLVRDPIAILESLTSDRQRKAPMHPLQAALYCWATELICNRAFRKIDSKNFLRIRYEDFLHDPVAECNKVFNLLELPPHDTPSQNIPLGPIFHGNRIIKESKINLNPRKFTPRKNNSTSERLAISLLAPLRKRHGYST